jgi:broad specificity phosphatase PhoE
MSEPDPVRVVLVRHGETEWSAAGRHTGRSDLPLTATGREQARRVGVALAGRQFDHVLTSPMSRAHETATLAGYGDVAVTDANLREWDYGVYEGRTRLEIAAEEPGWTVWSHLIRGGESLLSVSRRADRAVARFLELRGTILVFSHGHFLRILGVRWIGARPRLASHLELGPATISELGWETDRRSIELWNAPPTA